MQSRHVLVISLTVGLVFAIAALIYAQQPRHHGDNCE